MLYIIQFIYYYANKMNEHYSAGIVRSLSTDVVVTEKSKNFLKLLHLIQFVAFTNKKTNSINIYKGDPSEFSKTSILFFKFDYDDDDIDTLRGLGFDVTFHEKSEEFWMHGVIKNYYNVSWKQ